MKKVLIAYFSYSGNTRAVADSIREKAAGDIFEIKPVKSYPAEYTAVVQEAKKELNDGYRPDLAAGVQDMGAYDIVFIGYPNWWSTMPMGVFSFLEAYDFSGKTIIPFCTHGGGGLGRSERDIKKLCPRATVLRGLAIRGSVADRAQNDVSAFLQALGV